MSSVTMSSANEGSDQIPGFVAMGIEICWLIGISVIAQTRERWTWTKFDCAEG
jgi:hypothetical protein